MSEPAGPVGTMELIPNPLIIPVGAVIGILVAAPVGPVNVLCIQRAIERGFWGGVAAGMGAMMGDGLIALSRAYPQARIEGVERSRLLRLACQLRCPWAKVRQGDMWGTGWGGYALVYLFQRPESMERALAKARADMAPGAWLASLEFAVPGVPPDGALRIGPERSVWLYRVAARDKAHAAPAELPDGTAAGSRGRRYFGR